MARFWEWQKEKRRLNEMYDWWFFVGLPMLIGFNLALWFGPQ